MADINVTIKRFGTSWDNLYPSTIVDQISDASDIGKAIFKKINPSASVFLQMSGKVITEITPTTFVSNMGIATVGHTHTTAEISNAGDTLTSILAKKADIVGGKLVTAQVPDFLLGGARYMSVIVSTPLALDTIASNFASSFSETEMKGMFVVMGQATVVNFTTQSIAAPGDEGETASGLTLEAGDWLIYQGSNVWGVVNNTYRVATRNSSGVVRLSQGTKTTRSSLSTDSNGSGLQVMDESALRNVIKDIHYTNTTPSGVAGDLWFDGTF